MPVRGREQGEERQPTLKEWKKTKGRRLMMGVFIPTTSSFVCRARCPPPLFVLCMSLLCGCFGTSSIGHGHEHGIARTTVGQGRGNRIHNIVDPKSGGGGGTKAWDDDFKALAPKQKNILVLGLEGSGKTTLIHQLIDKKMLLPPPSTSIEQYKIVLNDTPMLLVDVPGCANISVREGLISAGLFALIFVIDWSDELRRYLATEHLAQLYFSNEPVRQVPLLVVVNKVVDHHGHGHDPDHDPLLEHGSVAFSTSKTSTTLQENTLKENTLKENTLKENTTDRDDTVFSIPPSPPPLLLSPPLLSPLLSPPPPPAAVTPELAAVVLGLSVVPHTRMRVVCCDAASGWGVHELVEWLNDTCSSGSSVLSAPSPVVIQDQSILW